MVSVEEAERIILLQLRDYGIESVSFENALGRVLAENILADRDFPPFNRVTMDGIAINFNAFQNGHRSFNIKAMQSAGEPPIDIATDNECIEIMTGAALPATVNTVIPYEEIDIKEGIAIVKTKTVSLNQNIHCKGKDKKQQDILVEAGQLITPAIISILATVGKTELQVKRYPKIIIVSTGDELRDINHSPEPFQIRRSNDNTLRAILKELSIDANILHLPDDRAIMEEQLKLCINENDIVLLSGGSSMGKSDYVPQALEKIGTKQLFYKVLQRPGKPFWFGVHERGTLVFAFPGNPVSTFMCMHRYFLPWLKASLQVKNNKYYAILSDDFIFKPSLQYFLQVNLKVNPKAEWLAIPVEGNGSGDFANLLEADAFMELPLDRTDFKKGEVFQVWPFKQSVF